jgi:tungstate transport system permease protein
MGDLTDAVATALTLIASLDDDLVSIVGLSLRVSVSAVVLASLIGIPLGAALALYAFPGRGVLTTVTNGLMGLPPVVVGLVVYILLSRSGPFGVLGLLFTPGAMIVAQCILVLPIIAALTRQILGDLWLEYRDLLVSLDAGGLRALVTTVWEVRFSLLTAVLAGFGRASAEVGAVMIVGGNIDHVTRVMTTAIALETSKGDLVLALALGIVLIVLSIAVNAAVATAGGYARRVSGGAAW